MKLEAMLERIEIAPNGCWLWTGAKSQDGYGHVFARVDGKATSKQAHREMYEYLVGPIPEGHELDHVRERGCVHRACTCPDHLEPVTRQENNARVGANHHCAKKTHCPSGHPYDEQNTQIYKGKRRCRACGREATRKSRERRLASV